MSEQIFENALVLVGKQLEPVHGYIRVEEGRIREIDEGEPPEEGKDLNQSFVLPGFVNAHTHLGDSVRKGIYAGASQPEVVGSEGKKFGSLNSASEDKKIRAMRESLLEMKRSGTFAHCDFRENGISGTNLLREAEEESIKTIILSRPESGKSLNKLLSVADGIGLPSLDSFSKDKMERILDIVSKEGKLLSCHVSETENAHKKSVEEVGKTEIRRALEMDPTFLVHGTWATEDDLDSLKETGVPLVLCPRSNSLLSTGVPPISRALDKGVKLWLGTDNISQCSPVMLEELSFAWAVLRLQSESAGAEEARELLKAATVNPLDTLDLPFGPIREGERASFLVLSRRRNLKRYESPHVAIVNRARMGNVDMVRHPAGF